MHILKTVLKTAPNIGGTGCARATNAPGRGGRARRGVAAGVGGVAAVGLGLACPDCKKEAMLNFSIHFQEVIDSLLDWQVVFYLSTYFLCRSPDR